LKPFCRYEAIRIVIASLLYVLASTDTPSISISDVLHAPVLVEIGGTFQSLLSGNAHS